MSGDVSQISIHLGAHKTATTFIQRNLYENKKELLDLGVLPFSTKETRMFSGADFFYDFLRTPLHEDHDFLQKPIPGEFNVTPLEVSGYSHILISEENVLGSPIRNLKAGKLYPGAADRLSPLSHIIDGRETTIYFSIRSYDSFFSSCATTVLRRGHCLDWHAAARKLELLPKRWPELIEEILHSIPQARLVVWRYEDFSNRMEEVFKILTGTEISVRIKDPVFQTLSKKAFKNIEGYISNFGKDAGLKMFIRRTSRIHQATSKNQKYSLFKEDVAADLLAQYEVDWKDLQQKYRESPRVTVLR